MLRCQVSHEVKLEVNTWRNWKKKKINTTMKHKLKWWKLVTRSNGFKGLMPLKVTLGKMEFAMCKKEEWSVGYIQKKLCIFNQMHLWGLVAVPLVPREFLKAIKQGSELIVKGWHSGKLNDQASTFDGITNHKGAWEAYDDQGDMLKDQRFITLISQDILPNSFSYFLSFSSYV